MPVGVIRSRTKELYTRLSSPAQPRDLLLLITLSDEPKNLPS